MDAEIKSILAIHALNIVLDFPISAFPANSTEVRFVMPKSGHLPKPKISLIAMAGVLFTEGLFTVVVTVLFLLRMDNIGLRDMKEINPKN